MNVSEKQTCDMCKEPVGEESLDLWAMGTLYDEQGQEYKTGAQIDDDLIPVDYIVICPCCSGKVASLWNEMVKQIYK